MTDENGNQLVAYFMPTEETLQNLLETRGRRDDQEEYILSCFLSYVHALVYGRYIYKLHREFSLPMDDRPRGSRGDDQVYALNVRDNAVMYTDLETKWVATLKRSSHRKSWGQMVHFFCRLCLGRATELSGGTSEILFVVFCPSIQWKASFGERTVQKNSYMREK